MSNNRDPLTGAIIGAAINLHRALGPGLLEGLYEDALCIELDERGLQFERQKRIDVEYKGRRIGDLYADIVVEDAVIVELKSVKKLERVRFAQVMTYMKLMNLNTGLLMNFNVPYLNEGIKRVSL